MKNIEIGEMAYVADWFKSKIDLPSYVFAPSIVRVVGEKGKAFIVEIETESLDGERDFVFTKYVPKRVLISEEEMKEKEKETVKKFENGKERYNKMIEFAKENNVKSVRVGLRKETILNKIKDAGLSYEY